METPVLNLKLRQTVYSSVAVRLIFCLVVLSVTATALEVESQSSVQVLANGPVVNVVCQATFPTGQTGYTLTWSVDGKELFVNGQRRENASPRYSSSYNMLQSQTLWIYTSAFSINNAVKQDEGVYECLAQYIQGDNSMTSAMDTIEVFIPQYLPTENDPQCNLISSNGDFNKCVIFTCTIGESNPNVILRLTLNSADGSEMQIGNESYSGNASATVATPVSGNLGTFVCTMTSSTFKTAHRICSVTFSPQEMPSTNTITILPTENQQTDFVGPITLSPEDRSSTNLVASSNFATNSGSNTVTTQITLNKDMTPRGTVNMVNASTWGIVGGVIGAFVASVTFIIIILFMRRHYTRSNVPDELETKAPSTSKQQAATDDPYSAYLTPNPEAYTSSNKTNVSPSDKLSSNDPYTAYRKQPEPEPYASLNQSNTQRISDQLSTDHPYTAYQKQPEPEPYAVLNQATSESSKVLPDSDYQDVHDYEMSVPIN